MRSNTPIITQTKWISSVVQILIMGVIMLIYYLFGFKDAIFFGAITYLLISFILKKIIPRDHRVGVKKNKTGTI